MNTAYSFGDQNRYIDRLDLVALQLLHFMWNGIGDDDLQVRLLKLIDASDRNCIATYLVYDRLFEQARRIRTEQSVCGKHIDLAGSIILQHLGRSHKRLHIVN